MSQLSKDARASEGLSAEAGVAVQLGQLGLVSIVLATVEP